MQSLYIAWKDIKQRLRDPFALLLSIAGPLLIVLILGLVFGDGQLEPTSAYVVNLDEGRLGAIYADALTSDDVKAYVRATATTDESAARAAVDRGEVAAAVIVPPGFTDAIFRGEQQQVEVYADPAATIGPAVVRTIVESLTAAINQNSVSVQTSLGALVASGRIAPDQQQEVGQELGRQLQASGGTPGIALNSENVQASQRGGALAYFAPAMLVFFLMFNAVGSGQSLLAEKEDGTLARLFTMPVSRNAVIVGKLLGSLCVTGIQAALLVLGLTLLFGVNLGQPLAVVLLLLGLITSVIALGLVIAGLVRNPSSVGGASQATVLVLGLIGGSMIQTDGVPVLQTLGLLAPNQWALDGFLRLAGGGGLPDVLPALAVLFGMTVLLALIGGRLLGPKLSEAA